MRLALRGLAPACSVVAVSSLYESAAIVPEGQQPGPDYLNAVCQVETDLAPAELLRYVKEIEHAIGRRPAERWAPRVIDIDMLLCGNAVVDTPELRVPHPLLAERNFVLAPLAEIAAGAMHPVLHRTAGELAAGLEYHGLRRVARWDADAGAWSHAGDEHDEAQ